MRARPLILRHFRALGDAVVLTALVRDLQLAYPGRYDVEVHTRWPAVWCHNPHVQTLSTLQRSRATILDLDYLNGIRASRSGEKVHFLTWFHREFREKTGIHVPLSLPRPDLHLTKQELQPFLNERYWVVVSGGKSDIVTKIWPLERWQEVIDAVAKHGIRFVQAGSTRQGRSVQINHPLKRVHNFVGKTENVRDFFSLINGSDGVLCGVTSAMHIAAAFEKPCVVVAGGREEPWWEAYVNDWKAFGAESLPIRVPHQYLHTLGKIECCSESGCWRSAMISTGNDNANVCLNGVFNGAGRPVPKCLEMISAKQVAEAVANFMTVRLP